MVFAFLISLHLFLMAGYVVLIETKKSRLNYGYLLFALFVPFVGELALLAADIGRSPAKDARMKPFKDFEDLQASKNTSVVLPDYDKTITREQLLEAIKHQPENLTKILKTALGSEDNEVVHIAASSIMKIQRQSEKKIKLASEQYSLLPGNMNKLKAYIDAIGEYYAQGLLNGEAAVALLKQQAVLIEQYLTVLPGDKAVGVLSVNNSIRQGDLVLAFQKAEHIRYRDLSDMHLWGLSAQICRMLNDENKWDELMNEAEKMSAHWSAEQKAQWSEICKGLKK